MSLILFALAMLAIMIMVALVIDLSTVRNTHQNNKLTADVATEAGAQALATDGYARPWRGVCAALAYLKTNQPSLSFTVTYKDGAGTAVSGNPCVSLAAQECVASTPTTWAWIQATSGSVVANIKSGYVTPDADFPEDATSYSGDNGVATRGGCDQLAVIVEKTDPALFGRAVGATSFASKSRSVGRVKIQDGKDGVPAFLMLERRACQVLSESVGVGGGSGIIVEPASATEPGIIHVDSNGLGTCNGTTEGNYTVYSGGIGSNPGIIAKPAGATPGILELAALPGNVAHAVSTASGVSPAGTPGGVSSRKPIDDKYNPSTAPTISNLHATAAVDANRSIAPAGYTTVSTCNNDAAPHAETLIFVNCPGGYSPTNVTFSAATDVIFNGPVFVPNNSKLFMPAATRIVVGGTASRGLEVAGGGLLGINSVTPFADTDAAAGAACTGREGQAWPTTTKLLIFGGNGSGAGEGGLNIGGRAALCQTFVYLAGPKSNANYARQAITDGSYDPSCLPAKPCANTSNAITNAHLIVSGLLRWSAPNQLAVQPAPGSVGVEDLALWTETPTKSEVKSGGNLQARGVHFLPNSRLEMRAPSSATPQDAQFISLSLKLFQGTLQMKPTPQNAVVIPVLAGVGLVR